MKYSITRALAELKLLKDRYNKEVYSSSLIAVKRGMKIRPPYTSFKEEDFVKTAGSQYQSIITLRRRMDKIKLAIDKSNFETIVKIGDKEMTVLEALVKKSNIDFDIALLDRMKTQLQTARAEFEKSINENNAKVESIVHDQLTNKDVAKKADVEKEACETVDKLYEVKMIDPLALEDKIKELESEIEEFQKNVDFVLSESNSKTYIEIPD
jgi:uncharacterized FlaG/YvyC family protein